MSYIARKMNKYKTKTEKQQKIFSYFSLSTVSITIAYNYMQITDYAN